jgi:MHS family citrate/tricarballylate:H+ symporter-like MFS transporter
VIAAAAIGFGLNQRLAPAEMDDWGWRVPFLLGCLIVPFIFLIRRSLQETEEFQSQKRHPELAEIYDSMKRNWLLVLTGMLMVVTTTVSFYIITAYTPTFGKELHLSDADNLLVTCAVGFSNFFWLPVMGALSDRVGRKPLLLVFTTLMALTAYPSISWLVEEPSLARLLQVDLWLSFLYASYNGAMVVALTEIMPREVRTAGFSLAYSLATAVFGGFTPAVCTFLIRETGNKASPGWWMTAAAVCGWFAAQLAFRPGLIKAAEINHDGLGLSHD